MSAKAKTIAVDRGYAASRFSIAEVFLRQAELSVDLVGGTYAYNAVTSAAVQAGIAAADAACGHALGMVSSSPNHGDGVRLLRGVSGSEAAVKALAGLVAMKTKAQYTTQAVGQGAATKALRQASCLMEFAQLVLRM